MRDEGWPQLSHKAGMASELFFVALCIHGLIYLILSSQIKAFGLVTLVLPSCMMPLFCALPRQALDAINDILERLLVLVCRVSRRLPLNILSIIPLDFECRKDHSRVEAVDIFAWVRGEAFELADEG